MIERICPSCGERVTDERARFCPICATALPVPAAEERASALEYALRDRYAAYNDWVAEARGKEGAGKRLLSALVGHSDFKTDQAHEQFFKDVKKLTEDLAEAYRAAPGAGDVGALLRFALVDCHAAAYPDTDWLYLAAEQLYQPLLERLTPAQAAPLYEAYRDLRKKKSGFGYQKQILKALKKLAG